MAIKAHEELKLTGRLPSPPCVGMAIIKITAAEDYEIEDVARVIRSDPALSGRVLKLCNSSAKAGIRGVTSIDEAIQRLGVRTLRTVALGFSLISAYRGGTCPNFDFGQYWSESLARAIAAQEAAGIVGYKSPADAYACGLFSGIGRLAFACVHPERYGSLLADPRAGSPAGLVALEKDMFEISNRELAAAMLADWGIPEPLVSAVSTDPSELGSEPEPVRELGRIIASADAIARVCIRGLEVTEGELGSLEGARAALGMAAGEFHELCDRVGADWRAWGGVLDLPTERLPSFAHLAAAGGRDLAGVPGESAAAREGRLRILAVDDDPAELRSLAEILRAGGHEVVEAASGESALAVALDQLPDLVISDLRMPDMDGVELVRLLRRCEGGRQMYVIVMIEADDDESLFEGLEAGFDDCLRKPLSARMLGARITAGARIVTMQHQLEEDHQRMRRQMSELAVLNRKLAQASLTDALTGIPNRRHALEHLQSRFAAARREGSPLAVVMIDIDHFKKVNDGFGHDVGDEVLRRTAAVLAGELRHGDCVMRLGGEEFLVVVDGRGARAAEGLAERLRVAVESNRVRHGEFDGRVTISLGVATLGQDESGPEDLLRRADEALYAAKRSGRNRVVEAALRPLA